MTNKEDLQKILPEVGFHLWQSYFVLFARGGLPSRKEKSQIRPFQASRLQRWAFPCLTAKGGLKDRIKAKFGLFLNDCQRWASRLRGFEASRGGLPSSRTGRNAKGGLFSFGGLFLFSWCQRWASIFRRWAFPCLTARGGLRGCKGSSRPEKVCFISSRLPEVGFEASRLREKPNKAFLLRRWAFPCLTAKGGLKRLYLSLFGFLAAKVGFQFWKVGFSPLILNDCQRWASMVPKVGFELPGLAGLPEVGFEASKVGLKALFGPLVGFHTFYIIYIR